MSCYDYEGTRYIRARHFAECDGADDCAGCLRCPENHCGECRKGTHLGFGEHTCPECVGKARATLRTILEKYAMLPKEATVKGVNSEAANLYGPAADAEALSHRRVSILAGRITAPLPEEDEHHPLSVLGRWVFMLGEDYGDEWTGELTVAGAVDYLDRRLGRIAHDAGQDFGQFQREVRKCGNHLDAILRDSGMGDPANVGCFDCRDSLERKLMDRVQRDSNPQHDTGGFEDIWTCRGCGRRYTYAEYNFALRAALEESA